MSTVRPREMLPSRIPGIVIRIDQSKYPALSAMGGLLTISKSPFEDIRRSDGRSSPVVILTGAIEYTDAEMEDRIQQQIKAKVNGRNQWHITVDRAILVAHDLSRDRYYLGASRDWEQWIEPAASHVNVLETFDELWLVTCRNMTLEATRICSRQPGTAG